MQSAVNAFLNFLRVERNSSALTIKSYADDLQHLCEFFVEQFQHEPAPDSIDVTQLRSYVAYMHECGYARATVARRLACLRSFFRFCCRDGLASSNPLTKDSNPPAIQLGRLASTT